MGNSQTTTDIDSQIAKLEEKLNNLFDKIQEAQSITVESNTTQLEHTHQKVSGKSRKEILAEYEKEYLARLEEHQRAEAEIKRQTDELESKKQLTKSNSPRGTLPKGF